MSVVIKTVNFIRFKSLRHRLFQDLKSHSDSNFDDVPYYCEIRWLSPGTVSKRMLKLKDEILQFMEQKGYLTVDFNDA